MQAIANLPQAFQTLFTKQLQILINNTELRPNLSIPLGFARNALVELEHACITCVGVLVIRQAPL